MRYGVLGTGMVGQALATKLVELGHEVRMGSREAGNEKAVAWAKEGGDAASEGTFADAASFGEVIVNATAGTASLEALAMGGPENLAGKVLIDVANPLDSSRGMPPALTVSADDTIASLAERIQRQFPEARVVKALNTVNARVMVNPGLVPGSHTLFIAGDDERAKEEVVRLLQSFGWPAEDILDLGDLSGARGMELYLGLWLRLYATAGTPTLNVKVIVGEQ